MGRDHSNLAQLSKHNLGGTICVPMLATTSTATAEHDRLNMAKADIERLCGTFGVDYKFLIAEMMERITTGMSHTQAIAWAKEQVMHRKAKLLPPKKKEYEDATAIL